MHQTASLFAARSWRTKTEEPYLMAHRFNIQAELWLDYPIDQVFDFFQKAENLERITPADLQFKIVTPGPIELKEGAFIDYRIKLHGLPFPWRTQITNWEPPHRFTDSQLRGPYVSWIHTHTFEERDGGTLMKDHVEYIVPGGPISPLIHKLFVRKNVENIFKYRNEVIQNIFPVRTTAAYDA